jgi:hypothetical protein
LEQVVVKLHSGLRRVRRRNPVNGAFHLTAVRRRAACGLRVVGTSQLDDFAVGVLDHLFTSDEIGVAQSNFAARFQPKEFLWRIFHKVVPLNV